MLSDKELDALANDPKGVSQYGEAVLIAQAREALEVPTLRERVKELEAELDAERDSHMTAAEALTSTLNELAAKRGEIKWLNEQALPLSQQCIENACLERDVLIEALGLPTDQENRPSVEDAAKRARELAAAQSPRQAAAMRLAEAVIHLDDWVTMKHDEGTRDADTDEWCKRRHRVDVEILAFRAASRPPDYYSTCFDCKRSNVPVERFALVGQGCDGETDYVPLCAECRAKRTPPAGGKCPAAICNRRADGCEATCPDCGGSGMPPINGAYDAPNRGIHGCEEPPPTAGGDNAPLDW